MEEEFVDNVHKRFEATAQVRLRLWQQTFRRHVCYVWSGNCDFWKESLPVTAKTTRTYGGKRGVRADTDFIGECVAQMALLFMVTKPPFWEARLTGMECVRGRMRSGGETGGWGSSPCTTPRSRAQ
eukprot:3173335-Rhodomonas_salina.1